MEKCIKCDAEKMFPTFVSMVGEARLEVAVYENPGALIFRQKRSSSLNSKTCGNCGYIEFYATNARLLLESYLEGEKQKNETE
jgi:predicted nucleic-acid-binding Zn-ribbon protein